MNTWDDKDFEAMLAQELTDLPPDDAVVAQTNPWEEPVNRIALGLALTTIKLNFLWLEFLLPTVGFLMLLLGFRTLRRENRWFAVGWGLSILRLAEWMVSLLGSAMGWNSPEVEASLPLVLLTTTIQVCYFLILRMALKEVFRKAEVPWEKDPLLLLAGLTLLMTVLVFSPLRNSWLAVLPTIIFYIYACNVLYNLPEKLKSAGYVLTAAPVKVSEATVKWAYWLTCLAIIVVGSLVSGHILLDAEVDTAPRVAPVRQELLDLGFPAEQLNELPDGELEGLAGAVYVDVSDDLLMFDSHAEPEYNSYGLVYQHVQAPGKCNLNVTAVTVEKPGHLYRTFLFFGWENYGYGRDHTPFWTDGFVFTMDGGEGLLPYAGVLRYEKDGQTWMAPVPELSMKEETRQSMFFGGTYTYCPLTGKVNYPIGAENRRGWLRVDFTLPEDQWLGTMNLNWYRSTGPRFPYQDPTDSDDFTYRDRHNFYATFQTLSRHRWEEAGQPDEWPPKE